MSHIDGHWAVDTLDSTCSAVCTLVMLVVYHVSLGSCRALCKESSQFRALNDPKLELLLVLLASLCSIAFL